MASPSNRRATKRRRSSITELAVHGIHTSRPQRRKVLPMCPVRSVTYVSGRSPVSVGCVALAEGKRPVRAAAPSFSHELLGFNHENNFEFRNTRAQSLRSHGGSLANCDSLRARAANQLDHVTLTPGAPASAVATDTLWVSFRPRASSPRSADRPPAQVVECHSKAAVRPIELLKLGDGVRISHAVRTTTS